MSPGREPDRRFTDLRRTFLDSDSADWFESARATISVPCPIFERQLDGLRQTGADVLLQLEAIDDHFDVVSHLTVEPQVISQRNDLAIDACADESLLQQVFEQIAVLALLTADDGSKHGEPRIRRKIQDAGENLLSRLGA